MANPQQVPTALVGLVSHEAEWLFERLRCARSMPVAEFDALGSPAAELVTRGLITYSPDGMVVRSVDLVCALRILLDDEQHRLVATRERVIAGWDQLSALLSSQAQTRPPVLCHGIQVLSGIDEVARQAVALYDTPRRQLRATEVGGSRLRLPALRCVRRPSVRYRLLCQTERSEVWRSAADLIRRCDRVGLTMVHVDDTKALVVLDRSAGTALLVHSTSVLNMLADWFDLLWDSPASVPNPVAGTVPELPADARRVLAMMASDDDATIARRMRVSVTTVRRKIRAIYQLLGVDNRFAAGMVAAKRGWI